METVEGGEGDPFLVGMEVSTEGAMVKVGDVKGGEVARVAGAMGADEFDGFTEVFLEEVGVFFDEGV